MSIMPEKKPFIIDYEKVAEEAERKLRERRLAVPPSRQKKPRSRSHYRRPRPNHDGEEIDFDNIEWFVHNRPGLVPLEWFKENMPWTIKICVVCKNEFSTVVYHAGRLKSGGIRNSISRSCSKKCALIMRGLNRTKDGEYLLPWPPLDISGLVIEKMPHPQINTSGGTRPLVIAQLNPVEKEIMELITDIVGVEGKIDYFMLKRRIETALGMVFIEFENYNRAIHVLRIDKVIVGDNTMIVKAEMKPNEH